MNGIVRFARATPTRTTRHDPRARINQFPPPPARCHCSHARRNAPNIASMRYPRKISGRRLLSTACTPKEQTPPPLPPPARPERGARVPTIAFVSRLSLLFHILVYLNREKAMSRGYIAVRKYRMRRHLQFSTRRRFCGTPARLPTRLTALSHGARGFVSFRYRMFM